MITAAWWLLSRNFVTSTATSGKAISLQIPLLHLQNVLLIRRYDPADARREDTRHDSRNTAAEFERRGVGTEEPLFIAILPV